MSKEKVFTPTNVAVKTYIAHLSQTGTANPIVTEQYNNTKLTFTWARTGVGTYEITSSQNIFTVGNTAFKVYLFDTGMAMGITINAPNNIEFQQVAILTNTPTDVMTASIEIKIFNLINM